MEPHHRVLEIGCGNGTTAVTMVEKFGVRATAVDIDPLMLERARATVDRHGLQERITLAQGDIRDLDFPDNSFDRVVIEAVTMFVDHQTAAAEAVRVCRPGGMVLDHEFVWRRQPTARIRHAFQVEVCPMVFETAEMWEGVYRRAGLEDIRTVTGKFALITPQGFVRDEGLRNTLMIGARTLRRWAFLKKTAWNLKRIIPAAPYLGYVVISGTKPASAA
jgi:cyclopropane fatty-acyl-phospholipid synthase-like methyltransferase